MNHEITERKHKALYALYYVALEVDRQVVTTSELYSWGAEARGVELLESKEDTAALLADFRDRGFVEQTGTRGRAFENKLTDEGMALLEELGAPPGIE